eukprot:CAMPEP_0119549234 /NCGR_PEP_ID=MMETSP1352-20130426/2981_1 /TAXON_ID=265584 /ORGANISM="Stauroneis constricta, Strain CCMP1120" /LENGTH=1195 /DNA_ID=CAMNT_0007594737 /DNA_START=594 /DNA_END=4181 /DNA_ORIENTATION=-
MGNTTSTSSSSRGRKGKAPETAAERAKKVVGDIQEEFKKSVKKLDDDHPAAQLIDSVCGGYFDDDKYRQSRSASFYSEGDFSEDGSRTVEDDDTYDDSRRGGRSNRDASTVESSSYVSQSDFESEPKSRRRKGANSNSFDTEDDSKQIVEDTPQLLSKPLASSFAKRCYFTKSGIGKTTQHYEGLTLTGNVVLMLSAAMKLKGCPTICDEDLRRVEQTYPNQFSRLPDELLLSSGWRRISKYCHFSSKPIPDGVPFFHSKQRLHPSGGYYFLLASAVGMIRPIDVEPLTRDTLVLLETDFPSQCDQAPDALVSDPDQWTLVEKFCFFSGGPINTEEDVYYQADFDGNPIFMLAFLSPSLTPEELYKLATPNNDPGLKSSKAVEEVESVYDLTGRDFDDLKLYHLGPCRALPQYILQPEAWLKVLPPHFLAAKEAAMARARDWEAEHGVPQEELEQQQQQQQYQQQSQEQPQHEQLAQPMSSAPGGIGIQAQQPHLVPNLSAPPHVHGMPSPMSSQHHHQQEPLAPPTPDEQQQQHQQPAPGSPSAYGQQIGAPPPPPSAGQHIMPSPQHQPAAYFPGQEPEEHYQQHEQQQQREDPSAIMSPSALSAQMGGDPEPQNDAQEYQRAVEEEGAFPDSSAPMDEAIANRYPIQPHELMSAPDPETPKLDPPEDEPPSLMKREDEYGDPDDVNQNHDINAHRGSDGIDEVHESADAGPTQQHQDSVFFGSQTPDYYPSPPRNVVDNDVHHRDHQYAMDPHAEQQQQQHQHQESDQFYPPPPEGHDMSPNRNYQNMQHHHQQQMSPSYEHQHGMESQGQMQQQPPYQQQYQYGKEEYYDPNQPPYQHQHQHHQGLQPPPPPPQQTSSQHHPHDLNYQQQHLQDPQQQQHQPHDHDHHQQYDDYQYQQESQYDQHGDVQPSGFHPDQEDFPAASFGDDEYYQDEEKKSGVIDDPGDPDVDFDGSMEYDEHGKPLAEGEADFTPIKRDGYTLRRGPAVANPSPRSMTSASMGSQSAALRGAQELLKKNRRRRMEMASKARGVDSSNNSLDQSNNSHMSSPSRQQQLLQEQYPDGQKLHQNPAASPRDDESAATWESGSEFTASVISGSSVWTDTSNPTEKSSRRALILQMAKARMKSNREGGPRSPTSQQAEDMTSQPIAEEDQPAEHHGGEPEPEGFGPTSPMSAMSGDANADIDIAADLD